jgi:hypothetical protein
LHDQRVRCQPCCYEQPRPHPNFLRQTKRQQQAAIDTPRDDEKADSQKSRQRYSATAGVEQPPQRPKTWTVQDGDDSVVHRGGQKHSKKRHKKEGKPLPSWGTGVNAIPIRS